MRSIAGRPFCKPPTFFSKRVYSSKQGHISMPCSRRSFFMFMSPAAIASRSHLDRGGAQKRPGFDDHRELPHPRNTTVAGSRNG
jgi:hypothetical protein